MIEMKREKMHISSVTLTNQKIMFMKKAFVVLYIGIQCICLKAQSTECNKLGAWLWYIEITGYTSHQALAEKLKSLGVKRIYVKVADGKVNTNQWPELTDDEVVKAYKSKGLEVWAWSYNYPGNDSLQAAALYMAYKTGYEGYIIDAESEFDGKDAAITNLVKAFKKAKTKALLENNHSDNFSLYLTTWGNPKDHNFKFKNIDSFLDGYMPQTYVENWGPSYTADLENWIIKGNKEYADQGATKPIHHIVSAEKNVITSDEINRFFKTSGPESSIWRIPGEGVVQDVWKDWEKVDWNYNFCSSNSDDVSSNDKILLSNQVTHTVQINFNRFDFAEIVDLNGRKVLYLGKVENKTIDVSKIPPALYILKVYDKTGLSKAEKFYKY